jgi:hypothetical protein
MNVITVMNRYDGEYSDCDGDNFPPVKKLFMDFNSHITDKDDEMLPPILTKSQM